MAANRIDKLRDLTSELASLHKRLEAKPGLQQLHLLLSEISDCSKELMVLSEGFTIKKSYLLPGMNKPTTDQVWLIAGPLIRYCRTMQLSRVAESVPELLQVLQQALMSERNEPPFQYPQMSDDLLQALVESQTIQEGMHITRQIRTLINEIIQAVSRRRSEQDHLRKLMCEPGRISRELSKAYYAESFSLTELFEECVRIAGKCDLVTCLTSEGEMEALMVDRPKLSKKLIRLQGEVYVENRTALIYQLDRFIGALRKAAEAASATEAAKI